MKKEASAPPKTEAKGKVLKAKKAGLKEVHSHTHTHTHTHTDPDITHFMVTQNTEALEAASEEHL